MVFKKTLLTFSISKLFLQKVRTSSVSTDLLTRDILTLINKGGEMKVSVYLFDHQSPITLYIRKLANRKLA